MQCDDSSPGREVLLFSVMMNRQAFRREMEIETRSESADVVQLQISWTIFLFSRKILSTSKWRIFRVSKGGAFSLLEKFSVRNWNFILPQKRV